MGEIWRIVTGHTEIGKGMGLHMMGLKTEDFNESGSLSRRTAHAIP